MLSTRCRLFKRDHVNPNPASLLGDIAVIDLEGPDAESFAQSQTMNDVFALGAGQWHWNGWLCPKGRVQALFALLRLAPGQLRLLLLDAEPAAFVTGLSRYLLRSKARLHHRSELRAFGEFGGTGEGTERNGGRDHLLADPAGHGVLDLTAEGGARRLRILPGDGPPDPVATARWREADLRHGLPRWSPGREHAWTPHMLSLQRLKAFSVKKGCYPGQEIVARTHFLGQAKRQAWWVDGQGLAEGGRLSDGDGRDLAEVVGATADGRGALVVGLLDEALQAFADGHPLRVRRPLAGLARPV
jgi:folate-binding protein YgfZ